MDADVLWKVVSTAGDAVCLLFAASNANMSSFDKVPGWEASQLAVMRVLALLHCDQTDQSASVTSMRVVQVKSEIALRRCREACGS